MMQEPVESAEQAEALVNTLQIESASLSDANLSGLSSSDLEQLADLQAELDSINAADIDTSDEGLEVKQMLDGDIVETEIGEQEVIIETEELEQSMSPDEILPDYKEQSESVIKFDGSSGAPPPLRPLTIAPKPTTAKVPMALKTAAVVNAGSGQQIVLIQSPGGTTNTVSLGGQPIKLVSAQGQAMTIPSLQNVQLANKSGGVVQLRAVPKSSIITHHSDASPTIVTSSASQQLKAVSGAIKKIIPQSKNIVAKVIMGGQQGQVMLTTSQSNSGETQHQQIKLVTSSGSGSLPTTAKTITLAQAQQMGLITSGKVQQFMPQSPTKQQTLVVNKSIQAKTVKVVPQMKSPTKILPAPIQMQKIQTKQGLQRVIIKQGGQLKTVTASAAGSNTTGSINQVIRLSAGQSINSSTGQIHQINVGGKEVQYIRFMTPGSGTSSATTNTTASAPQTISSVRTGVTQKAQVVPVAGITVNRNSINNKVVNSVTSSANSTQNIIKVVPISTGQTRVVAPKPMTSGQRLLIPATNSQTRTVATIPASALSQIQGAIIPSGNNMSQIVMLPAQYVQQIQNQSQSSTPTVTTPKVAVTAKSIPQKQTIKISPTQTKDSSISSSTTVAPSESVSTSPDSTNYSRTLEPNGIRPRKPCNCTKSLCLKLYCDCFANGEFCYLCNCMNCYNNLDKEEERQRAIRNCLERNPNAFRPKIGKGRDAGESSVRKHTKGCNCKRSGCLKNYCECYEAKIACSSNCKCVGCRNIEDSMEKKNVRPLAALPDAQLQVVPTAKSKMITPAQDVTMFRPLLTNANTKLPSTYMTNEVIEATNQCMIAQADEAERNMLPEDIAKRMILEEFGRCLVQIIECSTNATGGTT